MPIRKGDGTKEFRKNLQNPSRPINDTTASPDFENYLNNLNDGRLKSEDTKQKEAEAEQQKKDDEMYQLFCPKCRRPTLKRSPIGYSCGFCGLTTLAPLRMSTETRDKR